MSTHPANERHYSYGDYLTWPNDERWEIIDGTPYSMSLAPSREHQRITGELFRQIANFVRDGNCEVYAAPFDVRLPKKDEADGNIKTVVQPDISVICDPSKLDKAGCKGAPDWIIEVLSPATAAKDQIQKHALYQRHGVKEYWLVHPTDKIVAVYRLKKGEYGKPEISELRGRLSVSIFSDFEIEWGLVGG